MASSRIETVELPELIAIGLFVEATPDELPKAIPAAWHRLFERDTGATSFLAVSLPHEDGARRELVGYLAAGKTEVPDGLTRIVIPAQRYLRLIHDGPVETIAEGFEALRHSAAVQNLFITDFRLDFGYLPGLPPGRHELHLAIANPRGLLG